MFGIYNRTVQIQCSSTGHKSGVGASGSMEPTEFDTGVMSPGDEEWPEIWSSESGHLPQLPHLPDGSSPSRTDIQALRVVQVRRTVHSSRFACTHVKHTLISQVFLLY